MEKFKIKVKNLEYFIMKLENATVEEKIELLGIANTLKKKVEAIDERIKGENVPRETMSEKLTNAENKIAEEIKNEKVHTSIRK